MYPNFDNYTIRFNECIIPSWFINFRYLDKNLIRFLSPHISPESAFVFSNINYLRKEDITILDDIISDLSVDAYSKSQRAMSIEIYPDNIRYNSKCKLNNIKYVYTFIFKFSENFIREYLITTISNWILEDSNLFYLWRK